MWQSVDNINDVLCVIKEEHPEMYMAFMRKQHESLYGPHYDRHFADADVEKIRYTNASGEKKSGAHWNMDQILDATNPCRSRKAQLPGTNMSLSTHSTQTCVQSSMKQRC